jgi:hypothetical protein
MMDVMLGNAPDAFSCGEVAAWYRPFRRHHRHIDCSCGADPCPIWERLSRVPAARFHAAAARETDSRFVVDSSKELSWVVDAHRWASDTGMDCHTVVMWKDPVDLAHSQWKRGYDVMSWRPEFVAYYRRILDLPIPLVVVPLDGLLASPAQVLQRVCSGVAMPYFEGKERFWEKTHHFLFGSGGVRKQVQRGATRIRRATDPEPDFEAEAARVRDRLKADREVQDILARLEASSISGVVRPENGAPVPRPYPLWYYRRRLAGAFRRFVPEPYVDPR